MKTKSQDNDRPQRPLSGYKILDLSTVVLGPYCTQMLGDLGADIIKIEGPGGDVMRHAGPHVSEGMGPIFLTINRNKRSLVLDLKKEGAKEVLRKLVSGADALVHNIRAAGMKRLGFDYDSVRELRPDIIYCHAVGYGSQGQYAGRQAYDDLVQAAAGASFMLPMQDGSSEPRYFPGLIADKTTGLHAAYAILAAPSRNRILVKFGSGAALVFAALLLIIPGFLTDLIGLLLIIPVTRKFFIKNISSKFDNKKVHDKNIIEGSFEETQQDNKKEDN